MMRDGKFLHLLDFIVIMDFILIMDFIQMTDGVHNKILTVLRTI